MSQSAKTLHEFGSISIKEDLRLKTGSTTALSANITPAPVSLADSNATLTPAQLRSQVLTITPTVTRTLTLPAAADLVDVFGSVGDTIDFYVVNLGADTINAVIATPSTALVGSGIVRDASTTTNSDSGSAHFRIRISNVSTGTEAYTTIRLA